MRSPRAHSRRFVAFAITAATVLAGAISACSSQRPQPPTPDGVAAFSSASPVPSASSSSEVLPAGGRSFTVIGGGDVLLHEGLWKQGAADAAAAGKSGYYFTPLFASLKPAISSADLAICHMEPPLAPPNGPFSSYPRFSVPPQVAPALAEIGYDSCSTASNHSIDQGEAGAYRTLDALDAAGLKHSGTARSAKEAATVNLMAVNGVKVAHLSYTFSFNGLVRPAGKEWIANSLRTDAVLAEAKRAKAAGASVVIVSIHWGTEYDHSVNSQQTGVAKKLLASPNVDLILGHHAHVVQPLERMGDKWVVYGQGNEVSYQNFSNDTRDGILPRFTFTETTPGTFKVTKAEVLAIYMWLNGKPVRVYDVAAVLGSATAPGWLKSVCQASLERTAGVIGLRGAYDDGLVLIGG